MRKWIALLVFLALGCRVFAVNPALALPPKEVSIRVRFVDAVLELSQAPFSAAWHFAATTPDLKRRLILNLGTNQALRDLEISLNGQKQPIVLPADMRSASLELTQTLVPGDNYLEISSRQPLAGQVFLDAYMEPIDIPGAYHSRIPLSITLERSPHFQKGIVKLKFLEGMRIRVLDKTSGYEFIDLNGTNLSRLNHVLRQLHSQHYLQPLAYGKTPDEMERQEQALEARFHSEEANQNLFFVIEIDPTLDVWSVVDLLQTLPYFEEVNPYFAPVKSLSRKIKIL